MLLSKEQERVLLHYVQKGKFPRSTRWSTLDVLERKGMIAREYTAPGLCMLVLTDKGRAFAETRLT